MTKKKIEIIISIITVILFLEPPLLSYYPQLNIVTKLYAFGRYAASFLFLIMFVFLASTRYNRSSIRMMKGSDNRKNNIILIENATGFKNIYGIMLFSVFLNISLIIASYFNGTIYMTFVLSCATRVGFVAFNIVMFKELHEKLLDIYVKILTALILLNSATQILISRGFTGSGDGRVWLLGLKNTTTPYLLLDISIIAVLIFLNYYEKKNFIYIWLLLGCTIINRSSTAIIVIFLFTCVIISQYFKKFEKYVNRKILIIGYILLWMFFFVVIYYNRELKISVIIGNIFGKGGTFSGRINIWKQASSFFQDNYYWGAGIGLSFNPWYDQSIVVYSAHNSMLEFLSKFGFFTGCIFALTVTMVFMKCLKIRNKKISILMSSACILLFLAMQFEAIGNNYLFWMQMIIPYMLFDKGLTQIDLRSKL